MVFCFLYPQLSEGEPIRGGRTGSSGIQQLLRSHYPSGRTVGNYSTTCKEVHGYLQTTQITTMQNRLLWWAQNRDRFPVSSPRQFSNVHVLHKCSVWERFIVTAEHSLIWWFKKKDSIVLSLKNTNNNSKESTSIDLKTSEVVQHWLCQNQNWLVTSL